MAPTSLLIKHRPDLHSVLVPARIADADFRASK
jgi:hypothetical protein